jgi:hypothetical protein
LALDAETARLRHERLGDCWWGHATLDQLFEVRRQAVTRVKACSGDTARLLALLDDAIAALRVAPDRLARVTDRTTADSYAYHGDAILRIADAMGGASDGFGRARRGFCFWDRSLMVPSSRHLAACDCRWSK